MVGLRRLELGDGEVGAMELLGYEYKGEHGLPGRLFIRKGARRRTHHVHVVEWEGEQWHRHLAFRDYLQAHPEEAERYAAEKRRIALAATTYLQAREPTGTPDVWCVHGAALLSAAAASARIDAQPARLFLRGHAPGAGSQSARKEQRRDRSGLYHAPPQQRRRHAQPRVRDPGMIPPSIAF
jgi:hypothetical protein